MITLILNVIYYHCDYIVNMNKFYCVIVKVITDYIYDIIDYKYNYIESENGNYNHLRLCD